MACPEYDGFVLKKEGVPVYYHASQVQGITMLEPRVSNHGIPLIYFSRKRENVLVYLSNAIEKYCRETGFAHDGIWQKWGPYGFAQSSHFLYQAQMQLWTAPT